MSDKPDESKRPQPFRDPNTLPFRGRFSRAGSVRYCMHEGLTGREVAYELIPEEMTRRADVHQRMAKDLYLVEPDVLASEVVRDEKTGALVSCNLHAQPPGRYIGGTAEVSETEDTGSDADIIGHRAFVPATDRTTTAT